MLMITKCPQIRSSFRRRLDKSAYCVERLLGDPKGERNALSSAFLTPPLPGPPPRGGGDFSAIYGSNLMARLTR